MKGSRSGERVRKALPLLWLPGTDGRERIYAAAPVRGGIDRSTARLFA